jgi:C4-dicarboxylate-specific signal transduction histidine kinase
MSILKTAPEQAMQQLQSNVQHLLAIEMEAERERFQTREALVHAGKMAAIGRMVVGVNHEIKRPLASMRLLAQNSSELLAQGDAALVADNLRMLVCIMDQLDQLSRQLEGFSRKTPLKMEAVGLKDIVAGAMAILVPQLQTGRGKIDAGVGELVVTGDRDRLTLVLVNLLSNGLEAMADCEKRRIELDAAVDGGMTLLSVRDHGPGLSDAALEHLFEPFFTTKPPGKGLGMGLALSAEVLSEMGGELSARNHPEGGAQFLIKLPSA